MSGKKLRKKPGLPAARKYNLLREGIEEGLRGFLWNDVDGLFDLKVEDPDEERVERLVGLALNRIINALDGRFHL